MSDLAEYFKGAGFGEKFLEESLRRKARRPIPMLITNSVESAAYEHATS